MTLAVDDLLTIVREIADTDDTDFSDTVALRYLFRGFDDIIARQSDWKHFEVETTFSTVDATRDYTFASIYAAGLQDITAVLDDSNFNYPLKWIDYEDGISVWHGTNDVSGDPCYWSVRYTDGAAKLNLWPKPSGVRTIRVTGYRSPNTWKATATADPTAATAIDLPDALQDPLIDYVLSCWFDQQEDLELAAKYRQKFELAVATLMAAEQRASQARPLIFGGGHRPFMNEKRWREGMNRTLGS